MRKQQPDMFSPTEHRFPPTVATSFLTDGQVAWPMGEEVALMYLRGLYAPPEGWKVRRQIPGSWLWEKHRGCFRKPKRNRKGAASKQSRKEPWFGLDKESKG